MEYEAVIGMEVHAQILTKSKMFCSCSADYASAPPNTHTCPVCLGMPGVLPVINQAAVEATILTGLALHCEIPLFSKFDRKNYPYPDLPKGYQISQYDYPLCVRGYLDVEVEGRRRRLRIRRVHLEEDTAKLMHDQDGSLIDFNRAGVPLMEIVSEADMRSAEEAWAYLVKLRTILRYLGVSTGNMEEGAMRCEANVSIRPVGSETFGTKVEIKNLNSFRSVRLAIAYEIERQTRLLEEGKAVHQVTMGWDESARRTVFQRSKEYAEDYRYFPEPDLPPLELGRDWVDAIAKKLPELPDEKVERFVSQYGLRNEDAKLLVEDKDVADYFEAVVAASNLPARMVANWMLSEIFRLLHDAQIEIKECALEPKQLAELLKMVEGGEISAATGKKVLAKMFSSGEDARTIVERHGLSQISDKDALRRIVQQVLEENPGPLEQYLGGKTTVLGFFMGRVMRATRGRANAQIVRAILQEELSRRADSQN